MVAIKVIEKANATVKSTLPNPVVVIVGGTNGIGKAFMQRLVQDTVRPKVYYVGRSQASLDPIHAELTSLNASGTYIPILAGDMTLLSNVEQATQQIVAQESRIDILFMSVGFLTFAGRDESVEGLDKITSIRFYARMRFTLNLLPLLEAADRPRVISVLAGGMEGSVFVDDMGLRHAKNYGVVNAGGMAATYNTLFMEVLHRHHPQITFIHEHPGFVKTELFRAEHFGAVLSKFINWIVVPTLGRLVYQTLHESGKRTFYAATSPRFPAGPVNAGHDVAVGSNGERGSGVYTLDGACEAVHNDKVLQPYRENGVDQNIWDHTMAEYARILKSS